MWAADRSRHVDDVVDAEPAQQLRGRLAGGSPPTGWTIASMTETCSRSRTWSSRASMYDSSSLVGAGEVSDDDAVGLTQRAPCPARSACGSASSTT